ncbi:MAG: MATE family efflux transporter [Synergistaceae bacterium]|jgi:putative MATE family efflux protein|nr:MATE family efflux transporter [Synergistaceae bacterium]
MEISRDTLTENKMGVMPVHKLLLNISVPMVISMIVQALYNVVDSIFVAQIGENALTAVSLAFPIQGLMIGVGVGTGVGVNSFLSRSLGEKNSANASKSALHGIFLAWVSCAVFMFVGFFLTDAFFRSQTDIEEIVRCGNDYLFVVCAFSFGVFNQIMLERLLISTGKTFYSMVSQSVGAVTNILLDPVMIFGLFGFPRMEVTGAALATVIGQTVSAVIALTFNLRINHEISLKVKGFRPSFGMIGRIYSVALPSILMSSLGSIMIYGLNRILISFTATATAVFGVYFKLQSFIFMPIFGLNNGMVPIIAYNYGARKRERIVNTIKLAMIYAVGIMLLGTAVFQIFPRELLAMFNATPDMLALGIPALRIISAHFFFAAFCIVSLSVFQALGNGVESLIVVLSRQIFLLLPIAWLLSLTGDVNAIWWSFPITEFITLLLCAALIKRVHDKKVSML